jgi:hypothetical protein
MHLAVFRRRLRKFMNIDSVSSCRREVQDRSLPGQVLRIMDSGIQRRVLCLHERNPAGFKFLPRSIHDQSTIDRSALSMRHGSLVRWAVIPLTGRFFAWKLDDYDIFNLWHLERYMGAVGRKYLDRNALKRRSNLGPIGFDEFVAIECLNWCGVRDGCDASENLSVCKCLEDDLADCGAGHDNF